MARTQAGQRAVMAPADAARHAARMLAVPAALSAHAPEAMSRIRHALGATGAGPAGSYRQDRPDDERQNELDDEDEPPHTQDRKSEDGPLLISYTRNCTLCHLASMLSAGRGPRTFAGARRNRGKALGDCGWAARMTANAAPSIRLLLGRYALSWAR